MKVLREIVQLNNKQLNLTLPVNFDSKYVEVIILPYSENLKKNENLDNLSDFQNFLLSAPVMTDEEYDYYLEKKQELNQWK